MKTLVFIFIFIISSVCHATDYRERIMMNAVKSSKSEPLYNDNIYDFIAPDPVIENLNEIQKLNISKARVKTMPWSDDYWPIYKGVLANRYADEGFRETYNWQEAKNYVERNPALNQNMIIDLLSPAEKYDLLISVTNFELTKKMWKQGEAYFNRTGMVERWMGICHGWAPASYMVERPQKAIEVPSFNGKHLIKFYPSDLKALASLLWATTNYKTKFVGGRCRANDPEVDDFNRPLATDCLDNNPATFHLALLNKIGLKAESFVMDATYDYEVWNQPIISYEYKYFHPETRREFNNYRDALIEIAEFSEDERRQFRAKKTKYIIGVNLTVEYGVETSPVQREFDSVEFDYSNTAEYRYDLEINSNFEIIGGEWHTSDHPDFIWTPTKNTKALTRPDLYLINKSLWEGKKPLSKSITGLAKKAAINGKPLAYLVQSLIKLSNQMEK